MKRLFLLLLFASPAFAQTPVPITNPSFETTGGWVGNFGTWQPSAIAYTALIPDGKIIAAINNTGTAVNDLGVAALPNSTYVLTFWVGHRNDGYAAPGTYQLLAGTTPLCSLTLNSATIPIGTFAQQTLTCVTNATPPTGDLIISIVSNGTQTDVDDFALAVTPVAPPPPPGPYVFVLSNCGTPGSTCTFTFPIAAAPSLPACATADTGCYLSIQVCDTSVTPANCLTLSSGGAVSIVVNSPTAGVSTNPIVTATSP